MKPFAEFVGRKLWIHINGKTFQYEPKSAQRKKKGQSGLDEGDIQAPMPGKITAIMVKVGDKVQADQTLVVMEAMKMEYTLKTSKAATVSEIRYPAGAQVNAGDTLVCLKQ